MRHCGQDKDPLDPSAATSPEGSCTNGHHRECCARRGGGRARKGWIRAALLALLAERPMHGYEMIVELGQRTNGAWQPSPGAVYPSLQLLADEGLVQAHADGSRRRYALTEAGARVVATATGPAPWQAMAPCDAPEDTALRAAARQLDAAVTQVLAVGTLDQKRRAQRMLTEQRSAVYRLLGEVDPPEPSTASHPPTECP